MIEFIIIEEDKDYKRLIKEIIEKHLMNYDYEYKINEKTENNTNFKVYIVDYSNKTSKSLEILKQIRYEQDDWTSMIIVITTSRLINDINNLKLMLIDTIEKNKYFEQNIIRGIKVALRNYDNRPKSIKYKYKTTYYNIDLKDIMYIEKEKDSKNLLIKTKENIYPYPSTISNISKILDKRFIKCSRAYIINLEQVRQYNTKDNIITLKDGNPIYEISRDKKKDIINYLRRVD